MDAWLRLTECGFTIPPSMSNIDIVLGNTISKVVQHRPDLAKRAHTFFAERENS